jgi:hypothetical protein
VLSAILIFTCFIRYGVQFNLLFFCFLLSVFFLQDYAQERFSVLLPASGTSQQAAVSEGSRRFCYAHSSVASDGRSLFVYDSKDRGRICRVGTGLFGTMAGDFLHSAVGINDLIAVAKAALAKEVEVEVLAAEGTTPPAAAAAAAEAGCSSVLATSSTSTPSATSDDDGGSGTNTDTDADTVAKAWRNTECVSHYITAAAAADRSSCVVDVAGRPDSSAPATGTGSSIVQVDFPHFFPPGLPYCKPQFLVLESGFVIHVPDLPRDEEDSDYDEDEDYEEPDLSGGVFVDALLDLRREERARVLRELEEGTMGSYFEIEVLEISESRGIIGIGICCPDNYYVDDEEMLGFGVNTYGFHSDDGEVIVCGDNQHDCTGAPWGESDIVGCGLIISNTNVYVYFTLNGEKISRDIEVDVPAEGDQGFVFHPTLSFADRGSRVRLNTGARPFAYTGPEVVHKTRNSNNNAATASSSSAGGAPTAAASASTSTSTSTAAGDDACSLCCIAVSDAFVGANSNTPQDGNVYLRAKHVLLPSEIAVLRKSDLQLDSILSVSSAIASYQLHEGLSKAQPSLNSVCKGNQCDEEDLSNCDLLVFKSEDLVDVQTIDRGPLEIVCAEVTASFGEHLPVAVQVVTQYVRDLMLQRGGVGCSVLQLPSPSLLVHDLRQQRCAAVGGAELARDAAAAAVAPTTEVDSSKHGEAVELRIWCRAPRPSAAQELADARRLLDATLCLPVAVAGSLLVTVQLPPIVAMERCPPVFGRRCFSAGSSVRIDGAQFVADRLTDTPEAESCARLLSDLVRTMWRDFLAGTANSRTCSSLRSLSSGAYNQVVMDKFWAQVAEYNGLGAGDAAGSVSGESNSASMRILVRITIVYHDNSFENTGAVIQTSREAYLDKNKAHEDFAGLLAFSSLVYKELSTACKVRGEAKQYMGWGVGIALTDSASGSEMPLVSAIATVLDLSTTKPAVRKQVPLILPPGFPQTRDEWENCSLLFNGSHLVVSAIYPSGGSLSSVTFDLDSAAAAAAAKNADNGTASKSGACSLLSLKAFRSCCIPERGTLSTCQSLLGNPRLWSATQDAEKEARFCYDVCSNSVWALHQTSASSTAMEAIRWRNYGAARRPGDLHRLCLPAAQTNCAVEQTDVLLALPSDKWLSHLLLSERKTDCSGSTSVEVDHSSADSTKLLLLLRQFSAPHGPADWGTADAQEAEAREKIAVSVKHSADRKKSGQRTAVEICVRGQRVTCGGTVGAGSNVADSGVGDDASRLWLATLDPSCGLLGEWSSPCTAAAFDTLKSRIEGGGSAPGTVMILCAVKLDPGFHAAMEAMVLLLGGSPNIGASGVATYGTTVVVIGATGLRSGCALQATGRAGENVQLCCSLPVRRIPLCLDVSNPRIIGSLLTALEFYTQVWLTRDQQEAEVRVIGENDIVSLCAVADVLTVNLHRMYEQSSDICESVLTKPGKDRLQAVLDKFLNGAVVESLGSAAAVQAVEYSILALYATAQPILYPTSQDMQKLLNMYLHKYQSNNISKVEMQLLEFVLKKMTLPRNVDSLFAASEPVLPPSNSLVVEGAQLAFPAAVAVASSESVAASSISRFKPAFLFLDSLFAVSKQEMHLLLQRFQESFFSPSATIVSAVQPVEHISRLNKVAISALASFFKLALSQAVEPYLQPESTPQNGVASDAGGSGGSVEGRKAEGAHALAALTLSLAEVCSAELKDCLAAISMSASADRRSGQNDGCSRSSSLYGNGSGNGCKLGDVQAMTSMRLCGLLQQASVGELLSSPLLVLRHLVGSCGYEVLQPIMDVVSGLLAAMQSLHGLLQQLIALAVPAQEQVYSDEAADAAQSKVFESEHPYRSNMDEDTLISFPGAVSVSLSFDEQTRTEGGCDYVVFRDHNENQVRTNFSGRDGSEVFPIMLLVFICIYILSIFLYLM